MRRPVGVLTGVVAVAMLAGCAAPGRPRIVVWKTTTIPRAYEMIGPVSVTEQITESPEDTVQGIAGFISQDGRISSQISPEMKAALDARSEKYKDRIFEKLGEKAKLYDADAVIGAEYLYVPPYATFSTRAMVSARGIMIKYRDR